METLEKILLGDCPECGASFKGESFLHHYESELMYRRLQRKYVEQGNTIPFNELTPDQLADFSAENPILLSEEDVLSCVEHARQHQYPNMSRLIEVVNEPMKERYCKELKKLVPNSNSLSIFLCPDCGCVITISQEEQNEYGA